MILEIQNPSDAVTIVADDMVAAGIGILLVGSGWYGLEDEEGKSVFPILALGGLDKWLADNGISDINKYISDHAEKIAAILDTCLYGRASDRQLFESAISKMSAENAKIFRDEWNDKRRSSLTNIGANCFGVADSLRKKLSAKVS